MEDSKVAVILEDLRAQLQVFGEGLEAVRQEVSGLKQEFAQERRLNRQEHRQMMQMIRELQNDSHDELKRAR